MLFIFQIEDIRGVLKNTFQIEDNISWGNPESSTKLFSNRRYSFVTPMSSTDPKCMKNSFQIEDIAKIIPMLKGLLLDCWSFELLLHFATINIGMMFAISSIWKSFVPL